MLRLFFCIQSPYTNRYPLSNITTKSCFALVLRGEWRCDCDAQAVIAWRRASLPKAVSELGL